MQRGPAAVQAAAVAQAKRVAALAEWLASAGAPPVSALGPQALLGAAEVLRRAAMAPATTPSAAQATGAALCHTARMLFDAVLGAAPAHSEVWLAAALGVDACDLRNAPLDQPSRAEALVAREAKARSVRQAQAPSGGGR